MIAVATLDPSTLALWFNPTSVAAPATASVCDTTFELSLSKDLVSYREYYRGLPSVHKPFSLNIASAVWHEKRHFLDLLLTNYGSYRVRQFFLVSCNAFSTLKSLDKKLAVPFRVYVDPIRRRVAGVGEAPESVRQLIRETMVREEVLANESHTVEIHGYKCEMGGDAQLEALAYAFQCGANQYWLGLDAAEQWHNQLGGTVNSRYRWAELVAHEFGLLPSDSVASRTFTDFTLLVSILYASLMMRSWGQSYIHPSLGEVNLLPPYIRFRLLLDHFKGKTYRIASASVRDCWHEVNQACRELFGRTAIEELEADFEHEGNWVRRLDGKDAAAKAFTDYHNLRGELIAIFIRKPEQILDLNTWSRTLLPEVKPMVIIANSGGVEGNTPSGMRLVLDQNAGPTEAWWWAALVERKSSQVDFWKRLFKKEAQEFGMKDTESWLFVLRDLAPLTKLFLYGRRHDLMIGPELLLIEAELTRLGYELVFDSPFEFPVESDDTKDFYRLTSLTTFTCDLCRSSVRKGSGRFMGPWTIRRNQKLSAACVKGLGEGDLGLRRFRKDWSHWLVCDTCIDLLKKANLLAV